MILLIVLLFCGCSKKTEERQIRLLTFGYEDTRYLGLEQAIEKFNQHHSVQYRLEVERYTDASWNWGEYLTQFDGQQHDLLIVNSDYVAEFADRGYLEPLDDIIQKQIFQDQYLSPLIPCMMYNGKSWGLLIDTDVSMLYINRDVLRALGYTEQQIVRLPDQIRSGQFTMKNLIMLSHRAVEQGLSEYGMVHRPASGIFFYMMAEAFDAFEIQADGTIYFSEEAFVNMLTFFQDLAACNPVQAEESWNTFNDIFVNGKAAVYFGACWSIYDGMIEKNADPQRLEEQYITSLIPAISEGDSPFTISNSMLITLSSHSLYKDDLKEILIDAYSQWETCAEHAAQTYHMPVSRAAADDPVFQKNTFLLSNLYMMDYTTFVPNTSNMNLWYNALFQAVKSVENGSGTPEEVAHTFAQDVLEHMKN